jgi:RNA polymerase sigma-70 factor (ECF subfamily)
MIRDDAGLPDEELLRIARQDPGTAPARHAASQLLGRYRGRVYAWCRRYTRNHERALDLSQEVLTNAYRALGGYEGRAPFSAWLFVIARRQCIRAMRPRRLTRDDDAVVERISDPRPGPDRWVEERHDSDRLLRAMSTLLDAKEQDAVWMRYVECASVDEITRALGLTTLSGARGLLQTARRKLRAALAEPEGSGA